MPGATYLEGHRGDPKGPGGWLQLIILEQWPRGMSKKPSVHRQNRHGHENGHGTRVSSFDSLYS